MRQHQVFLVPGFCVACLLNVAGCADKAGTGAAGLSPDALTATATATCNNWLRMRPAGDRGPLEEVPTICWTSSIRALHPLRVYLHRLNVAVVQAASGDTEEGKYVTVPISSYAPRSGDDGFTFTHGHAGVYDFKRSLRSTLDSPKPNNGQ